MVTDSMITTSVVSMICNGVESESEREGAVSALLRPIR